MTPAVRTLVLTRRNIAGLMGPDDWLTAVETGFRASAEGEAQSPPPMQIGGLGGAFHAKGASLLRDRLHVALKLNSNFPANPDRYGLPTIQGAILLCDGETGRLVAILDSIEVTLRRTAAATALAARFLARPDCATILVCGCGEQGAAQLAALRRILPLRHARLWDRDRDRAGALARDVEGMEAEAIDDLAEAAGRSDVIVTCTTAREPFLGPEMVRPGTFVAAVGADSPDKSEIRPELMARARIVADVVDQCARMGDLHHALAAGAMRLGDVHAGLAELVAGTRPGRVDESEIFLFDSTGTALQDVAAAAIVLERARGRKGLLSVALGAL